VRLLAALASALTIAACITQAAPLKPPAKPPSAAPAASSPLPTGTPPAVPSAAPAVPQSLLVEGDLNARLERAAVGTPCGRQPAGYYAQMTFPAAGVHWTLTMGITAYSGAGRYAAPPARVGMHKVELENPVLYAGTGGTLVVNADELSGSINEDLESQSGHVHVSGSWSCPAS